MNRRNRRASGPGRRLTLTPADIRRVTSCPDCGSEVESIELEPSVYEAVVRHDDTCPWFAAFQRDRGYGVRFW
ncbi:hypothetical protein [Mycolicibacterium psychrotolerans]|uniref:Uncharacterized protein n=1 Tax=Mycolicibacterium psychrotolerans TaxID=216929 RepID=A0A7I7MEA6_9MYCO|nr:hypothetical protein [Mycolicibacterium psychrotolerans]BBX69709.1 hypothetical protein MPSYJ_31700 [Mycolicibacterium psychrotolerans]